MSTALKLDRRGFFRKVAGERVPLRPPGSLSEELFAQACDGCGACVRACPQAILVPAAGGLPRIDFSAAGCTFCGACAEACAPGAILAGATAMDASVMARVGEGCLEPSGVTCRVCESACDAAAFRFRPMPGGRSAVTVLAERCTGCGACVSICPAGAIAVGPAAEQHPAAPAGTALAKGSAA